MADKKTFRVDVYALDAHGKDLPFSVKEQISALAIRFSQEAAKLIDGDVKSSTVARGQILENHVEAWLNHVAERLVFELLNHGTPGAKDISRQIFKTGQLQRLAASGGLPAPDADKSVLVSYYLKDTDGQRTGTLSEMVSLEEAARRHDYVPALSIQHANIAREKRTQKVIEHKSQGNGSVG